MDDGPAPKLIDTSAIYYLDNALKKSHEIRVKYHGILWNFGLVFVVAFIFCTFLYYRYTSKPTPSEANYKLIKDQEFVLSKIRFFQEQNKKINESNYLASRQSSTPSDYVFAGAEITGLPVVHPST